MKLYDLVAPIYNRAIEKAYLPYRQAAVKELRLQPSQTVIDIGCGTGLNFELLLNGIGDNGTVVGIDSSSQMLQRARQLIQRRGWNNVHLLQMDIRKLTYNDLKAVSGVRLPIDSMICTLGFSVFPDWRIVFERSFDLLKIGGRYSIMDIFNDQVTLRTHVVNTLAGADNSRRIWEPLKEKCEDYSETKYPMPHGDTVVVASGVKPDSGGALPTG